MSHAAPPLACTVRDCGLWLERRGAMFRCTRGHAYDIARSGYINLLQPQDRRSPDAGDSREAVAARTRLLMAGIGRQVIDELVNRLVTLPWNDDAVIVDLGSGGGELLGTLESRRGAIATAIGIDLSTPAIDRAARSYPDVTWVVANADRRLPLLDRSVDLVLSVHGRRNPEECARVLTRGGCLIVAVPAHDDLIELRASVQGHAVDRERSQTLLAEYQPHFVLTERFTVRRRHVVQRDALIDLLRGTYRGARRSVLERVEALTALEVTVASDVLVFTLGHESRRLR